MEQILEFLTNTLLSWIFPSALLGMLMMGVVEIYNRFFRTKEDMQEINSLIKAYADRDLYKKYKHKGFGAPITFDEYKYHQEFYGEE